MPLNSRWIRVVACCLLLTLLGAVVWAATEARWTGVAILGGFALASGVFMLVRDRLPALFSLLFVLAALVNGCGWAFGLWSRIPGYDPFAHGYTSFAVTLAAGFLTFYSVHAFYRSHPVLFGLMLTGFGVTLGVFWEILEWIMNVPQSYFGIIQDLILDLLGAAAAGALATWTVRHESAAALDSTRSPRGS